MGQKVSRGTFVWNSEEDEKDYLGWDKVGEGVTEGTF